jgi:hypothetical protein
MSGRFGGQWAFLSTPPTSSSRSLPPSSSYLRSDQSNISPLPTALHFHQLNDSRSSLPRFSHVPSLGGRSTVATIPSHPVLVRIHSADPILQVRPTSRPAKPRRKLKSCDMDLPPVEEFSFRNILAAIAEDIEEDVDAIAEILGRSRLVLADQHDSQMPPQGEIRAIARPLQAVAEASSSNERLASIGDDVLILREDASLVEGSHTGSAAYGLLERLQTVPCVKRTRSAIVGHVASRPTAAAAAANRQHTDPAIMPVASPLSGDSPHMVSGTLPPSYRRLLQGQTTDRETREPPSRTTRAVVSETYLSAGANAVTVSDPPIVSEGGRHYPLYSYDYTDLFEGPAPAPEPPHMTVRERLQSFVPRMELASLMPWMYSQNSRVTSAESQLREILHRQHPVRDTRINQDRSDDTSETYEAW